MVAERLRAIVPTTDPELPAACCSQAPPLVLARLQCWEEGGGESEGEVTTEVVTSCHRGVTPRAVPPLCLAVSRPRH